MRKYTLDSISQLPCSAFSKAPHTKPEEEEEEQKNPKINKSKKLNHWTNNLERLKHVSREIQQSSTHRSASWKWTKNENNNNQHEHIHPNNKEYCQQFSVLFSSLSFFVFFHSGRWVHNWIISEDFMYALSYISGDYCFLFSRPHVLLSYILFFGMNTYMYSVPIATYCVHEHTLLALHLPSSSIRSCVLSIHLKPLAFSVLLVATHTHQITSSIESSWKIIFNSTTTATKNERLEKNGVRFICKASNWIYLQLSINIIWFPNILSVFHTCRRCMCSPIGSCPKHSAFNSYKFGYK